MPVPLAKTAVRLELPPGAMVVGLATKLLIDGAGAVGVVVADADPPHPARPPKPRLKTRAHAAYARILFIIAFLCAILFSAILNPGCSALHSCTAFTSLRDLRSLYPAQPTGLRMFI